MKYLTTFTLLTITLLTSSGCAKFREMTRRDYASLRDPFAKSANATDDEPPVGVVQSTSGFVQIEETQPSSAKANYAMVSQTKPVEPKTESGFQGIRVRGMGDAISTEVGTNPDDATIAESEFEAEETTAADNQTEVAEAFLSQPQKPKSASAEPSDSDPPADLIKGFAAFAESRREDWAETATTPQTAASAQTVNSTQETASPLIKQPIRQVSESIEKNLANNAETATPLLRRHASESQAMRQSPLANSTRPAATADAGFDAFTTNPKNVRTASTETANQFDLTANETPAQEAPVFDEPIGQPLLKRQQPTKNNPFALTASERETSAAPKTVQENPQPNADDQGSVWDAQWQTETKVSPATSNSNNTDWAATPSPASKAGRKIDQDFNWDNAWKPSDAVNP